MATAYDPLLSLLQLPLLLLLLLLLYYYYYQQIIVQRHGGQHYLDIRKNRYDGDLGVVPLRFQKHNHQLVEDQDSLPQLQRVLSGWGGGEGPFSSGGGSGGGGRMNYGPEVRRLGSSSGSSK